MIRHHVSEVDSNQINAMSTSTEVAISPSHSETTWLRLEYWLPWLVLVISLLITWQLWRDAKQSAIQELQSNFDFRVHEVSSGVSEINFPAQIRIPDWYGLNLNMELQIAG